MQYEELVERKFKLTKMEWDALSYRKDTKAEIGLVVKISEKFDHEADSVIMSPHHNENGVGGIVWQIDKIKIE